MKPIVIVGAGMGGLAAAACLAGAGLPVHVVERGPRAGGKAGIAVIDGVEVDTGPSVLTMPDVFADILRRAGTSLSDVLTLTLPEPASRYVYPGGLVVDVFSDPARTVQSVHDTLGADAARQADAFLRYSRRVWEAAAPWFVYGAAPTPGHVLSLGPRAWASVARIDATGTMNAGIERHVQHPELQWIFQRYATYNGSDPRRAPGTLNCIAHVELGLGVHGVKGGIHALVRALEQAAVHAGATFQYDTGVTSIRTAGGRVQGVTLSDGTSLQTDHLIANADAAHVLADLLPAGTRHGLHTHPTPSMSGWVGIVRARRTADRVGHTVLFPDDYRAEFTDIFDRDRPPVSPTVYVCAQERCHQRQGWDDAEPLFVMANAPAEPAVGERDPATWPMLRDVVMARLRAEGLVHPDDTVVWERSPRGLALAFPGSRGAIYGAASNDMFAAFRRPPNRIKGVPGLYLASGSAHPGGGMPLCALSGRAAADAVLRDLGKAPSRSG